MQDNNFDSDNLIVNILCNILQVLYILKIRQCDFMSIRSGMNQITNKRQVIHFTVQ